MKTMIKKAGYFLAMFALAACEPFDFEQEMGQKVICIISDNDLVYTGMHPQPIRKHRISFYQLWRLAPNRPGCGRYTGICSGSIAEL